MQADRDVTGAGDKVPGQETARDGGAVSDADGSHTRGLGRAETRGKDETRERTVAGSREWKGRGGGKAAASRAHEGWKT